MCLRVDKTKHKAGTRHPEPLIASEDLKVYKVIKVVKVKHNGTTTTKLKSPYQFFEYKKGFIYFQKGKKFTIRTEWNDDEWRSSNIEDGLHAWVSCEQAKRRVNFEDVCIYEARIPAGSEYYLGMYGDIVSDQLQLIKKVN